MANLIAFFEPFAIHFFEENNRIVAHLWDYDLFFYYNSASKQVHNSSRYKIFLSKNYPNFFENFYEHLENQQPYTIDSEVIDAKSLLFKAFDYVASGKNFEKIYLVFDTSFSPQLKSFVSQLLSVKYFNELLQDIGLQLIKSYLITNKLDKPQNFNVLCNYDSRIVACNCDYDGTDIKLLNLIVLDNIAFDPFTYEAAKNLCSSVYRIYNISASNPAQKDILLNYYKLLNKGKFYRSEKNDYVFSLTVENSPERLITRLKTDEIGILAKAYAKNAILQIKETFQLDTSIKLLLFGSFFENEIVLSELKTYTKNFEVLKYFEVFSTIQSPVPVQMVQAPQSDLPLLLDKVIINNLQIGDKIKLSNFDPRPDKGWAYQHFEYIGDKRFIVIDSTRGLKPGDIVETADDFWHIKTQIVLDVYRANKLYGKFQTREIQKIELFVKKK